MTGQTDLSRFPRLKAQFGAAASGQALQWRAQFGTRQSPSLQDQAWLTLSIQVGLPLVCQHCLSEFEFLVDAEQLYRFVADEEIAQREDETSAEDLLVLSRTFDLAGLVEDEVIMNLPVLPRHEVCPKPLVRSAVDRDFDQAPVAENPFAALAQLKNGKPH